MTGESGAVSLNNARLTVAGALPKAGRAQVGDRPVILIALRNLGLKDVEAVRASLDGAMLKMVHTTSTQDTIALQSLLTGQYPGGGKRSVLKADKARGLARLAKGGGRSTVLVSGTFPQVLEAAGGADYDVVRIASPKTFSAAAPDVLAHAEKVLREMRDQKIFTTVLLGDAAFPFFPRTASWRRRRARSRTAQWVSMLTEISTSSSRQWTSG